MHPDDASSAIVKFVWLKLRHEKWKEWIILATLERAIEIAVEAHKGQKDKAGMPYVLHPLRLMFKMESNNEKIAALLHDVVEDSDWTLDDLKKEGFNSDVIEAVSLLTRDEKDSYDEFVQKTVSNPISKNVKIADINDNLDLNRLNVIMDKDIARIKKYHRILKSITNTN